jgi:O-antigen/teichoic acid export membrane protein
MATIYTLRHHLPGLISGATTKLIRPILTTAWPFGLLGLLGTISLNTDIIMIGWFKAAASVGYYSTAQKPIQLLYALPAIIGGGLFPALARFAALGDGVRLRALVERALGTVLAIATPLAILGLLLGDYAIELVFGPEYRPAATSFRILALTLPIVYPATILGNTLFALNAERKFTAYVLVGVVSNFLGNLLLIPRYGIAGAAIATIIAQLLSNLLFWTTMKKLLPTSLRRYAPPVALSGLIMALSIFILILLDTPPIFAALLGGAAYAATFTLLGGTQLFASFFKNSDMETLEVAS